MTIRVSVVIPTYRRPALLQHCLTALLEQDIAASDYEIIVVDDAACASTQQLVERLARQAEHAAERPPVRYLALPAARGPAAARNAGWRAAEGAIIAFTDDDCIPAASWLRCGVAAFAADVAGVSGRVVVPLPAVPTDYERNFAGLAQSEFVTANCFYRRESLAEAGGFDERFRLAWREDSDLFFTLLKQGRRLSYAADAVVTHPLRRAGWGVSLQQQRKSTFNALLYKKHPALYRQRLSPVTPWHYYVIVLALFAACGGLASRRHHLALGASLCWLLLTGRFCLRRLEQTSHTPPHVAEMIITSALIPPLSVFWRILGALKFRVFFV